MIIKPLDNGHDLVITPYPDFTADVLFREDGRELFPAERWSLPALYFEYEFTTEEWREITRAVLA